MIMPKDKLPLKPGAPKGVSAKNKNVRSSRGFGTSRESGADQESLDGVISKRKQISVGREKPTIK